MLAALHGHLNVVEFLVQNGANINLADNNGNTALMSAAFNGYLNVVEFLFQNGANINLANNNGNTALMVVDQRRHPDIVKFLLSKLTIINILIEPRYFEMKPYILTESLKRPDFVIGLALIGVSLYGLYKLAHYKKS